MSRNATSPARNPISALVDALEEFLDMLFEGRAEELDEREREAVDQANAAIAAAEKFQADAEATWASAQADAALANERWAAGMRERFGKYPILPAEEKIRLAMDILHDVLDTWDHETLTAYPEDAPSFDEFLDQMGNILYAIRWNHGNAQ